MTYTESRARLPTTVQLKALDYITVFGEGERLLVVVGEFLMSILECLCLCVR